MRTIVSITIGLLVGVVIGWAAGQFHANRKLQGVDPLTSRFPEIRAYIVETVPFLRRTGAEQLVLEPVPYEGGGAVLVRGSVRNGDEFYILHTLLENRLTNPDLPTRLVWQVELADTDLAAKAKTR
jgi:hypothetical protein